MPRTDNIILPEALRSSRALAEWAKRASLDLEQADDVWKSATYIVQEMQESGLEPAQCMHTAQVLFMLIAASCKLDRDTTQDFFSQFADQAFDAARFFAEQCAPAGVNVSEGVSYDAHH